MPTTSRHKSDKKCIALGVKGKLFAKVYKKTPTQVQGREVRKKYQIVQYTLCSLRRRHTSFETVADFHK
jgi:hypothetical protein